MSGQIVGIAPLLVVTNRDRRRLARALPGPIPKASAGRKASRASGRRTAPASFSARSKPRIGTVFGVGSIHRSFRPPLRAVFLSFFTEGRSESAWSARGSARAATEAEIYSIGLASESFAAEF